MLLEWPVTTTFVVGLNVDRSEQVIWAQLDPGGDSMRRFGLVLATILACGASGSIKGEEILNIGDSAPALVVSDWVKGEKIDKFEPGTIYVVEFWATWCGPCRASIPHLTELAHQYKDKGVKFIGVDVWERDITKVKPFLDEMGAKMDYNVALDVVPEKGNPDEGVMAKTWLKAAEENGIPTAFVVRDRQIAWIGHPMDLDAPLAKIVAGNWDTTELAKNRLTTKAIERKASLVREKVFPLYRAKDYKATASTIDEMTSADPELAKTFAWLKFAALCNGGEADAGLALGAKLLDDNFDKPGALNNYFWNVIDLQLKNEPDPRVVQLALRAARRANELNKRQNLPTLDTLAVAHYRAGDVAEAIAIEEKALKQLEETNPDRSDSYHKLLEERLALFRKAATKKTDKP
jgi:thiol-disulfide isomerase/thioredoxin